MITLYSHNTYRMEDFEYLSSVLESALKTTPCEGVTPCDRCDHRMACNDLMGLYRYVSDKLTLVHIRRGKS